MIIKNFTRKAGPAVINKVIADFYVRYWEDCEIDGQEFDEDTDEDVIKDLLTRWNEEYKIGLVKDDRMILIINPETGKVENYAGGKEIRMHFKVCDECSYQITERVANGINPYDAYDNVILEQDEDYVPDFLSIDDKGYGDYVEITLQADGTIKDWDPKEFERWVVKESARVNGGGYDD